MKTHFLMSEKIDDDAYNDYIVKYIEMVLGEASENPNDQESEFFQNTNDVFIQPFLKAEEKSQKITLLKKGLLANDFDAFFYLYGDQFIGLVAYQTKQIHDQKTFFIFRYYLLPIHRRKFINFKVFLSFIEYCRENHIKIIKCGKAGEVGDEERTTEQDIVYNFLSKMKDRNVIKGAKIDLKESTVVFE